MPSVHNFPAYNIKTTKTWLKGYLSSGPQPSSAESPLLALLFLAETPLSEHLLPDLLHNAFTNDTANTTSTPPSASPSSAESASANASESGDRLVERVFAALLQNLSQVISQLSLDSEDFKAVLDVLALLFECRLLTKDPFAIW